MELAGRIAVITGAGSGIGRAIAFEAASRGMALALADIDASALADTTGQCGAMVAQTLDIRDRAAVGRFASNVFADGGSIALLFANAGVLRAATLAEQRAEDWERIVDVNLKGTLATITAFLPGLIERAEPARIVLTGSQSSFLARPNVCVYSATKQAIWSIAEGLSFELEAARSPVRVSLLAPGAVATPIARPDIDGGSAPIQAFLDQALVAHGLAPEVVARQALDAVAADRFWILPHPGFKPELEARTRNVVEERDPRP